MTRVFSSGGGLQSTAALVLAARGIIDYPTFLFCNVGHDSEYPATLQYVREVAMPYAQKHGINLIELQKCDRDGVPVTLYQRLTKPESKSIEIPVRMSGSGAPGNRNCTYNFKIAVVDKWCKSQWSEHIKWLKKVFWRRYGLSGALKKEHFPIFMHDLNNFHSLYQPIEVGLGISLDEIQRMKPNMDPKTIYWKVNTHPLINEVSKPLTRQDCINIIKDECLPLPPKSACIFCPYHTLQKYQEMRTNESGLFWKVIALEKLLNERRKMLGKDDVWLTKALKPLDEATTDLEQCAIEEDSECEGYCFV